MAYALAMPPISTHGLAHRMTKRVATMCAASLFAAVACVAAPTNFSLAPAAATGGVFDVSGWAPWWQPLDALAAYTAHSSQFGELSPFFFSAQANGTIATNASAASKIQAYKDAAGAAGKPLIPTVVDGNAARVMAGILADPAARTNHIWQLLAFVLDGGYDGVDLDYEQFAFADGRSSWTTTRPHWVAFITELSAALHSIGKTLEVSVPPIYDGGTSGISGYWVYDYAMLGQMVDRIRVMTYSYSTSSAGPMAPYLWVSNSIDAAIAVSGQPAKIVMGIPLYGTDWITNVDGSCPLVVPSDMKLSKKSYETSQFPALAQRKGATPLWNGSLQERTFTYTDSIGGRDINGVSVRCNVDHTVFYMDPDGVYARIALAKSKGISGVAFWALGNDDAATWTAVDAAMAGSPNPGYLQLTPNVVPPPLPAVVSALPARFVDTRAGMTTIDGQHAARGLRLSGSTLEVQIAGRGVVPANARSVAINVTAVALGEGYITVYPCGQRPSTSNLNVRAGQIISNSVVTKLSITGSICIYNQSPTHLVVDIFGVLSSTTFTPVPAPARLLDTRPGERTTDGQMTGGGAMTTGSTLEVPVAGRGAMGSSGQTAVLNVTIDGATTNGYLTLWACGTEQPKTSNINYVPGVTVANAVVTALGANGSVCVFSSGAAHVIIDTFGELSSGKFAPLAQPARLLDTRPGLFTVDQQFAGEGVRSANTTLVLDVGDRAGLGASPAAVILNVTVDAPALSGFVTVYPCGGVRPNVSNVNYASGQTLPNLVISAVSSAGTLCVFTSVKTHVIVDIFGSLTP